MWTNSHTILQITIQTPNPYSCQERARILCITCSNASPFFESTKYILNYMTVFIKFFVILSLLFAILFGRYANFYPQSTSNFNDFVCIITTVCKQTNNIKTLYELQAKTAIRFVTRRNKYSDDTTIRIHGNVYFGIEPPFVRPISWFPPTAPQA